MQNVFFKPWIGKNYEKAGIFQKKILALGEAHICGGCETCGIKHAPFCEEVTTKKVIEDYLKDHSGNWSRTFRKFERALVGVHTDNSQSDTIWNSIAFYNYIQVGMDASRKRPTDIMFTEAERPFWEVIEHLGPDLIIVWGKTRMYDNMPFNSWKKDTPIKIENVEAYSGWYRLNGKEIRIIWIAHPSSAFSWSKWHKIIKNEII